MISCLSPAKDVFRRRKTSFAVFRRLLGIYTDRYFPSLWTEIYTHIYAILRPYGRKSTNDSLFSVRTIDSADGTTLLSKVLAQTKLTLMLTLTLNPNPTKP